MGRKGERSRGNGKGGENRREKGEREDDNEGEEMRERGSGVLKDQATDIRSRLGLPCPRGSRPPQNQTRDESQ